MLIAIEAIKERESLAELSERVEVHPNMISKWKQEFIERGNEIFEKPAPEKETEKEMEQLYIQRLVVWK